MPPVHKPVIGGVLEAATIGPEELRDTLWGIRASGIEALLGQAVEKRQGGGAFVSTCLKHLVEGRKVRDISRYVTSIEDVLPLSQRAREALHERADDQGLDIGEMSEYPECVASTIRSGEHQTVITHVLDAGQDELFTLLQVRADELNGFHRTNADERR